jgi:hypothetical protein
MATALHTNEDDEIVEFTNVVATRIPESSRDSESSSSDSAPSPRRPDLVTSPCDPSIQVGNSFFDTLPLDNEPDEIRPRRVLGQLFHEPPGFFFDGCCIRHQPVPAGILSRAFRHHFLGVPCFKNLGTNWEQ